MIIIENAWNSLQVFAHLICTFLLIRGFKYLRFTAALKSYDRSSSKVTIVFLLFALS